MTFQSLNGCSITGWAIPAGFTGDQYYLHFSHAGGASFTRLGLRFTSTGALQGLARRIDADGATTITSTQLFPTGVLIFGALVADYVGSRFTAYANGMQVAFTAPAWGAASDAGAGSGAALGASVSAANFMNGELEDVRFYDYALTQGQIVAIMNAGISPAAVTDARNRYLLRGTPGAAAAGTDIGATPSAMTMTNTPLYAGDRVHANGVTGGGDHFRRRI